MSASDGVNGTACTADQYLASIYSETNPYPNTTCLTHGQSIGLTLTAGSSFLSLIAIMFVFVLIGRNVLRYRRDLPNGSWKLLQGPCDIYMLSLFVYDVLTAMGGILDVRWAHNGIVTVDPYCTAQGVLQQIGDVGVALITLILAVHTFVVVLWSVGSRSRYVAFGVVALATLFIALRVGLSSSLYKNYEMPTPYWCWIAPEYKWERLAGEYIWLWMALLASVILNIPLYIWSKKGLSFDLRRVLWYPLGYAIIVLPLSISRWLSFKHKDKVPSAAIFFSVSIYNLSGAINVLLFLVVRPGLLLFTPPKQFRDLRITDPSTSWPKRQIITTAREDLHMMGNGIHNSNDVTLSPIEPIRPRLEELEGI